MMSAVPAEGGQLMTQHAQFDKLPPYELHLAFKALQVDGRPRESKGI